MNQCSECGRPLDKDENDLCPACESAKSHKKKKLVEYVVGAVLFVGTLAIAFFTGGKDGGKA